MNGPQRPDPRVDPAATTDDSLQDVHAALLREQPEPSESPRPVPLLLLALVSLVVGISGFYLGRYNGGFDPLVYDEEGGGGASAAAGPVQVDPVAVGKRLYLQNCASCHQVGGAGTPGVYPPLVGSDWVTGTEERNVRILLHGLGGPITVNGVSYGSAAMPAFGPSGANFKDDKIAAVLTYIRQEWGNKAPPVTAEQVAKIRAATTDRAKAWTAAELLEVGK